MHNLYIVNIKLFVRNILHSSPAFPILFQFSTAILTGSHNSLFFCYINSHIYDTIHFQAEMEYDNLVIFFNCSCSPLLIYIYNMSHNKYQCHNTIMYFINYISTCDFLSRKEHKKTRLYGECFTSIH